MSQYCHLQIEFELICTLDEYRKLVEHAAPAVARAPGLVHKLWLVDEVGRRAGGAYLFTDRAAAVAYVEGPIVAALRQNPALCRVETRLFDVLAAPSELTRGLQGRAS